jgi:histidine triad (HIT) family protein
MRPTGLVADCVFCDKIAKFVQYGDDTISEHGEWAVSFEPLEPVTAGHLLFVPTTHVADASRSPYITSKVIEQACRYARTFRRRNEPEATMPFNLITSAGSEATQSVMHLHVHYIPREYQDGLALPWTEQGWDH